MALVTKGECTAEMHRTSPTKGYFSMAGKQPTNGIHRNKNRKSGKMRQQRNAFQMKEQGKTREELNTLSQARILEWVAIPFAQGSS